MSKQIDSFILPDNIIKYMKDKIKETKRIKTEVGFALCRNKDSSIIVKGTECIGTKCSIKIGQCLEKDQTYIGNYHTHPRTHPTMSITDMTTGCSEDIECIGSAPFNTIRCFIRKTEESQCFNEISSFEEAEHKLIEKGEELREILRSPMSIIRMGISKLLKDTYQYDTEVAKYHKNRVKLLNKNFNRTDIK